MEQSNSILKNTGLLNAIRNRRSVRGYTDQVVDEELLKSMFSEAQAAPSNCNTQPWQVYVASRSKCEEISAQLSKAFMGGEKPNLEFDFYSKFEGEYRQRQVDSAFALYDAMGIDRNDKPGRKKASLRNQQFFDAPHVAFIGMPKEFGAVNAVDVGIYLQTLMLVFSANGVACCPQLALSFYPQIVKPLLNIPEDIGIIVGVSFGYEDVSVAANTARTERAILRDAVRFYG